MWRNYHSWHSLPLLQFLEWSPWRTSGIWQACGMWCIEMTHAGQKLTLFFNNGNKVRWLIFGTKHLEKEKGLINNDNSKESVIKIIQEGKEEKNVIIVCAASSLQLKMTLLLYPIPSSYSHKTLPQIILIDSWVFVPIFIIAIRRQVHCSRSLNKGKGKKMEKLN